ncbi:MAG: glutamate synthase [Gammaproteobacteria bacterium]|nr:glutamate synthase [Gammaproteobacteria bacterium]
MQQLAGVEVHAQSDDGRLVVTVEETPAHRAADTVMDLHNVAGVLSAAVVYHHNEFETEEGSHETQ